MQVVKCTTKGAVQWSRDYGLSVNEYVHGITTNSSGVIFVGSTRGSFGDTYQGYADGFVHKLNPSGSIVWSKHQGTTGFDETTAMLARTNGEVYAAGWTNGVLGSTNNGGTNAFLRRLDSSSGNTIWTEQ